MGGSGDYRFYSSGNNIEKKLFAAQKESKEKEAKSEVNNHFSELLKDFNDRDINEIDRHLENLKTALEADIDGSLKLLFGGSVSKHTYVDGISDIDVLVTVNTSSLANENPQKILDYFYQRIKERLPHTEVKAGNLAVTIKFSKGIEIQLLPAIKTKTGLKIYDKENCNWTPVIKPAKFAQRITEINKANNGNVVPVIKLVKSLNSTSTPDSQLTGYHIEALAVDAFSNYTGKQDYLSMVNHFCSYVQDHIHTKIKDVTSQSYHVDEYLGNDQSEIRTKISKRFERIVKKINLSLKSNDTDTIKDMF
jgi:hypothetical protein